MTKTLSNLKCSIIYFFYFFFRRFSAIYSIPQYHPVHRPGLLCNWRKYKVL